MDRFDVQPTVAEFRLLRKLYRANLDEMFLTSDFEPMHTRQLEEREFIIVKPPSALSSQGKWCIYLCSEGAEYYLHWRAKLIARIIGIILSLLAAGIGIA